MEPMLVSLLLSLGLFSSNEPATAYVSTLSSSQQKELVEVLQKAEKSQDTDVDSRSDFVRRDWVE